MTDETKDVPSGADLDAVATENQAAADTATAVHEAPAQAEAPAAGEEKAKDPVEEPNAEQGQAQPTSEVLSLEDRVAVLEAQHALLLELLEQHGIRHLTE